MASDVSVAVCCPQTETPPPVTTRLHRRWTVESPTEAGRWVWYMFMCVCAGVRVHVYVEATSHFLEVLSICSPPLKYSWIFILCVGIFCLYVCVYV